MTSAAPDVASPDRVGGRADGWPVLAVVAVGGAVGASARYGVDTLLPADRGFPLATFGVNVVGCLLLGLVAGAVYRPTVPRLLQPFLVVGVLGGFTTFSAYTVEVVELALAEQRATSLGYLVGTVVAALVALDAGLLLGRWAAYRSRSRRA